MSHIHVHRRHELDHDKARQSAEKIAEHLDNKFGLRYHWEGDTLHFERSGVNGHIDVEPTEVRIQVRLGFLLAPMKARLEQSIHRYMDELFENA